jgi:hypothetical protein
MRKLIVEITQNDNPPKPDAEKNEIIDSGTTMPLATSWVMMEVV